MRVLRARHLARDERPRCRRFAVAGASQRGERRTVRVHDCEFLSRYCSLATRPISHSQVLCFLGPFFTNVLGFKYTLALGAVGFPLYAAALYTNNRYGTVWFVYVGSIICGITAGIFWSVEGAIATGYPEPHKRGRYVATWLTFRNCGNLLGGAVSLALNAKDNHKGKVGYKTYQAFIAIQCLGALIPFALSNPHKVIRDDGSRISAPKISMREQGKAMWRLLISKPILLLAPMIWYYGWTEAYPGTYMATYLTVRSRSLASFTKAIVQSLSSWVAGCIVDVAWHRSRRTRALTAFGLLVLLNTGTWVWAVVIQTEYHRTKPVLDWADQRTFGRGFGAFVFESICFGVVENWIYWSIGTLSDSPGDQVRYSSILRGIETASNAVGYGVQATTSNLIITAALNLGFWIVTLPFSYFAALEAVDRIAEIDARGAKRGGNAEEGVVKDENEQ